MLNNMFVTCEIGVSRAEVPFSVRSSVCLDEGASCHLARVIVVSVVAAVVRADVRMTQSAPASTAVGSEVVSTLAVATFLPALVLELVTVPLVAVTFATALTLRRLTLARTLITSMSFSFCIIRSRWGNPSG